MIFAFLFKPKLIGKDDLANVTLMIYRGEGISAIRYRVNSFECKRRFDKKFNQKATIKLVRELIDSPVVRTTAGAGVGKYIADKVSKTIWWKLL